MKNFASPARVFGRRHAFTLIELLVVVSIIALLIAILLPSLAGAKANAAQAACASNIKQLGIALKSYLAEADNMVPVNGTLFPKMNVPTMYLPANYGSTRFSQYEDTNMQHYKLEYGVLWTEMGGTALQADPKKARVFMCPMDGPNPMRGSSASLIMATNGTISNGPGASGYWSYSVNTVLNSLGRFRNNFTNGLPWSDPLKATSIVFDAQFVIFVEEDPNVSSFNDEVFEPPAYRNLQDPNSEDSMLTTRHNHGGNVGFGDGHVEWWNELLFDQGPTAGNSMPPDNWTAMQHPVTRMFFPDFGAFATPP